MFCVNFFLNQSMFPFRTRLFAWAATAHSLRQILYSYKIKLLQGRWCRIAFAHLALGGRSLETEEEKRSVKTGIEGWRKPSRLLHPWRVEQICFVRRPPMRPHSLTPPSHRYSLTTPTFLHDPLTHSRFIPFFFFFSLLETFTRFCHPHAWLQATGWGEMEKEERGSWFQQPFLQGGDGAGGGCRATRDQ